MLKQYTLRMPGAVFGGEDSLDKLTNLVEDSAKVAVFTDKGIEATGLAALVTAKIEQAGKEYVVFDDEGHGFTKKKNQIAALMGLGMSQEEATIYYNLTN